VNDSITNTPADKVLIDRILRGDTQAFALVVRNTENLVAQIVFKLIPGAEDRKDLAQDIYLKAYRNLAGFKFQAKLSTWIAQIAYNTCLSWREKKKLVLPGELADADNRFPETADDSGAGNESESLVLRKELTGILQLEISRLPPIYQTLITLFHQESQTYEELAQITGLPEGTVKSYLFRARRMLKTPLLSQYKKEAL
jgi:RNA polymerase sigma factor (sigma-70 family)